jgi:hypothetical protein
MADRADIPLTDLPEVMTGPDEAPHKHSFVLRNALQIALQRGLPIGAWNTLLKSGIPHANTTAAGVYAALQPAIALAFKEFLRRFIGTAEIDPMGPLERLPKIIVDALNGGLTVGTALALVEQLFRSNKSDTLVMPEAGTNLFEAGAILFGIFVFGVLDALCAGRLFKKGMTISREYTSAQDLKAIWTEKWRVLRVLRAYLAKAVPAFAAFAIYPLVHHELKNWWEDTISPNLAPLMLISLAVFFALSEAFQAVADATETIIDWVAGQATRVSIGSGA